MHGVANIPHLDFFGKYITRIFKVYYFSFWNFQCEHTTSDSLKTYCGRQPVLCVQKKISNLEKYRPSKYNQTTEASEQNHTSATEISDSTYNENKTKSWQSCSNVPHLQRNPNMILSQQTLQIRQER